MRVITPASVARARRMTLARVNGCGALEHQDRHLGHLHAERQAPRRFVACAPRQSRQHPSAGSARAASASSTPPGLVISAVEAGLLRRDPPRSAAERHPARRRRIGGVAALGWLADTIRTSILDENACHVASPRVPALRSPSPEGRARPIGNRMRKFFNDTIFRLARFHWRCLCGLAARIGSTGRRSPRPIAAPVRPTTARPATAPAAAPAPRGGAACHNGMSFDRFLADLKQQAVAAGVSQRALAEAAPYLVYDQSIVNRDRGQRVFGQVFNEFARNRASDGAAKNAQARDPDACGSVQPRREGIWRAAGGDRRVLGAGEQFRRRTGQAAYAAVAGVAGV